MSEYNEYKDKLEDIRAALENDKIELNEWEINFIDGVFENYFWTGPQKHRINNLHDRLF